MSATLANISSAMMPGLIATSFKWFQTIIPAKITLTDRRRQRSSPENPAREIPTPGWATRVSHSNSRERIAFLVGAINTRKKVFPFLL
jgi:hypothetical protein